MPNDTITLALNGDSIPLGDYAKAIDKFRALVDGLTSDVAPNTTVKWAVVSLEASSAIATIRGLAEDETDVESIERVADAYLCVGRSLSQGTEIEYSREVATAARELVSVINGSVKSVRFENADDDVEISSAPKEKNEVHEKPPCRQTVFGSMRGRVQSLSNRGTLRFTLYDMIEDKAISCYLAPGMEEQMRDSWGKVAVVEGRIHRDRETGRVTTIRGVSNIVVLPENEKGAWRQAIGCAPGFLGDVLPEEAIRRSRDD
jgi:hypothetical protein